MGDDGGGGVGGDLLHSQANVSSVRVSVLSTGEEEQEGLMD